MKKIIEESNMKLREFSEYYGIPYNTVRQWYNEERKTPEWVKKLIEENLNLKRNGCQIPIGKNWYYFEVIDKKTGRILRNYIYESEEKREKMIKINTGVTTDTIIFKKDLIEII